MPQIELKTPDASPDEAGWFDRSSRPRLVIAGPDRAKFLHNLTTNDVKRLAVGSGHESFVTTPQGKVLAYVTLLALEDDSILLRTDPESLEVLLPHLRKYGVFDDVTIDEVSSRTFEYHVIGRPSPGLEGVEMPPEPATQVDLIGPPGDVGTEEADGTDAPAPCHPWKRRYRSTGGQRSKVWAWRAFAIRGRISAARHSQTPPNRLEHAALRDGAAPLEPGAPPSPIHGRSP